MTRRVGQRQRARIKEIGDRWERMEDWRKAYRAEHPISLPPDVIRNICIMMEPPSPKRVRYPAEQSIGVFGQGPLATMMRVSKMCNAVAAPILYNRIITDDMRQLLYGAEGSDFGEYMPLHRSTKTDLLARCRHLHLEPSSHLIHAFQLLKSLRYRYDRIQFLFKVASAEGGLALHTLLRLGGFSAVMPRLRTLSIGISNYSSDDLEIEEAWPPDTRREDIWTSLLLTPRVPVICSNPQGYYPFYNDETFQDRIEPYNDPDLGHIEPVLYLHIDSGGAACFIRFDTPNVFLYSAGGAWNERGLKGTFDRIFEVGHTIVENLHRRRSAATTGDRRVIVEFRVARDLLWVDPFDALIGTMTIDSEIDRTISRIWAVYDEVAEDCDEEEEWSRDEWRISVTDGQQLCPACRTEWTGVDASVIGPNEQVEVDDPLNWSLGSFLRL